MTPPLANTTIVGPGFPSPGLDPSGPPAPPASLMPAGSGGGGDRPVHRGYEGAIIKRTDADFLPPPLSINALNARYLPLLRRRCRWLIENNPHARRAVEMRRLRACGHAGIWGEPDTGDEDLDAKIRDYFWSLLDGVDPGREVSLAESQGLFVGEVCGGGEALSYRSIAPAWRGYAQGPALEVVECERLDLAMNGKNGGNVVRQAVEFEGGKRVRYHVLKDREAEDGWLGGLPMFGGGSIGSDQVLSLSAQDATLAFFRERAAQVHGVPWLVAVVDTTRLHNRFMEAALLAAQVQSAVVGTYTGVRPPSMKSVPDYPVDADGRVMQRLEPAGVQYLPPGAEYTQSTPPNLGQTLTPIDEVLLRHMAAGLGLDYASLTGDRTKSTFSSDRSGMIDARRGDRAWQRLVYDHHTRPWRFECLVWGIAMGKLKLSAEQRRRVNDNPLLLHYAQVIGPGTEWIDPLKEANADEVALRNGTTTLARIIGERGESWESVQDQRLKEERREIDRRQELGLPPRAEKVTAASAPLPAAPERGGESDREDGGEDVDETDGADGTYAGGRGRANTANVGARGGRRIAHRPESDPRLNGAKA